MSQSTIVRSENNSDVDVSTKIGTLSNVGSESDTKLVTSSTGNSLLGDDDRWMITTDSANYGQGDPINTWVRFGTGFIASSPIFGKKLGEEDLNGNFDNYLDTIPVTVAANDYVLIMQFNRLVSTTIAAIANAPLFNSNTDINDAGYLTGIAKNDLLKVVNWDFSDLVIPTKLNSLSTNKALSFYPNPASEGININVGDELSLLTITNITGNVVLSQQVVGNTYVNISNLPKGTYVISGAGIKGKLVKN